MNGILRLLTLCALLSINPANAVMKTICGADDDRELSTDPKVGRLLDKVEVSALVCTATMISKSCALTAGHCKPAATYLEFNTEPSTADGNIILSAATDRYMIDQDKSVYERTMSTDWAVLRIKPNETTGLYAGDVQGTYEVDMDTRPRKGDILRITGYGVHRDRNELHRSQKTHTGEFDRSRGLSMYHRVDTTGGNSGSSILNEDSQKVIGIHTHGGCYVTAGANKGTRIYRHTKLIEAIKTCLAEDAAL